MMPREKRLSIGVQEEQLPWSKAGPTEQLLDVFQRLPWAPFTLMEMDPATEKIPFDAPKFIKRMSRRKSVSAAMYIPVEGGAQWIEGSIAKHPLQNTVVLTIGQRSWRGPEPVIQFMVDVARLIPEFYWARANADRGVIGFAVDHDLYPLPHCFRRQIVWLHLLSPNNYSAHFDRDVLLAAPAHEVREFEDGLISIMTFENPYAYDEPENRERQIALHHYLHERKKRP